MINEMRQSYLQEMLLLQEDSMEAVVQLEESFVELARQLEEDPFEPKILAWKHRFELALNSRPLLLGLRPGRCGIEARYPRLGEQLAIARPR